MEGYPPTGSSLRELRKRSTIWSRLAIVLVVLTLIAAACGDDEGDTGTAAPETTAAAGGEVVVTAPEIPASEVRFAMYPCCADQALYQIPIDKGWFDEVGISLNPEGAHQYTLFDQIVPSMERGDFDVAGIFVQGYLQTLDTFGMDIPPIWFNDIYVGYAILKAPGNDAKTTQDFVDEGMEFGDAAAAAVQQLEGQEVYTPPHGQVQPPYPDVFLSYGGMSYPDSLDLQFLEDNKIVEVATQEGRIDYAIPYAAPVLVQMLRNGWEPVIDTVQTLSDVGSEQAARMTTLVGSSGLMAQRDWVEGNRDTALRLLSVMFRTLDFLNDTATQTEGFEIEANLINATQGLELIPEDVGTIWESIDPMFHYEEQGDLLWDDPNAPFHVRTSLGVQLQTLIDNGTLEGPIDKYDLDEFLLAEELYRELVALQGEADALFSQASGATLSSSQQDLVNQAQGFYDAYNFLDATRYLEAALQ